MTRILAQALPIEYAFDFNGDGTLRRVRSQASKNADNEPIFATEFYVNDDTISNAFGRTLAPLYADWTDVALAAYWADRLSRRRDPKKPGHGFQWARRMRLKIAVRLPEVWTQPAVSDALGKALRFFTDDEWYIEFVARRGQGRLSERQQFLFAKPIAAPRRVALLSGGLDSFAGAAGLVADLSDHSFVFVSGITNSRQRSAQREQVRAIRSLSPFELRHIAVPFGARRRGRSRGQDEERSQRARGFLFLTLGAVAALTAEASELYIHENGVGAVNLPYNATQLGASSSRGVHPLSLLRMGELAEALTGCPFVFKNSFLYATKGQMCRHSAVRRLSAYIRTTFSCDGFPVQAAGKPQCGSCTSCLLRRASLEAAGLSAYDPSGRYVCDLSNPDAQTSEKQLQHLHAMEWQFLKISQRLRSPDAWHSMVTEFTDLQSIASELAPHTAGGEAEVRRLLLELYRRYVAEWERFSARDRLGKRSPQAA